MFVMFIIMCFIILCLISTFEVLSCLFELLPCFVRRISMWMETGVRSTLKLARGTSSCTTSSLLDRTSSRGMGGGDVLFFAIPLVLLKNYTNSFAAVLVGLKVIDLIRIQLNINIVWNLLSNMSAVLVGSKVIDLIRIRRYRII